MNYFININTNTNIIIIIIITMGQLDQSYPESVSGNGCHGESSAE